MTAINTTEQPAPAEARHTAARRETAERPIRAVVLGGHVTALGVVRALRGVVERCEVWDRTRCSLCRRSRFTHAFRHLDVFCEERVVEELLSAARSGSHAHTFVFPAEDITAGILSRNREKLLEAGLVPVADEWWRVERFYYKERTYELADELGIPRPRTAVVTGAGEPDAEVPYPLILKPNVMATFHSKFLRKAVRCDSEDELRANYRRFAGNGHDYRLMAQEIIPGSAKNQYSLGMLRMGGRTVAGIAVRRKRQYPIDFGTGTFVETCEVPNLREYSEALLGASGYNGICEVEFKFDERDGKLKLFEVNPRLYKWHALGLQLGLNYPKMFIDAALGRPVQGRFVTSAERHVAWRDVFSDIASILGGLRKGDVTVAELIRDLRVPKRDSVFCLSDFRPFCYLVGLLPRLAKGGRDAL